VTFRFELTDRPDVAEFQIYDTVGDFLTGGAPTQESERATVDAIGAQLASLPSTVTTLNVRINVVGGLNHVACGIYHLLRQSRFSVVTSIENLALSAGATIAQAGAVRRMAADGLFMIHSATMPIDLTMFPKGMFIFTAPNMREYAAMLDRATESTVRILADRSGRKERNIRQLFEVYLGADAAWQNGMVDEIVPARPPLIGDLTDTLPLHLRRQRQDGPGVSCGEPVGELDNLTRYLRGPALT
jgi:ATP-dependent protease ClpP protease subunit